MLHASIPDSIRSRSQIGIESFSLRAARGRRRDREDVCAPRPLGGQIDDDDPNSGDGSMATLLMPKATAVWLVENTGLTFDQIAAFCTLHPLEVKGIADGDVAAGMKGLDPVQAGQISREELEKGEADPEYRLKLLDPKVRLPDLKRTKGPRYTPVSKRQDRPNAIQWLLKNHPELKDAQIIRLVGTTKSTIQSVRERSHWNSGNLQPLDPVTLGLCSQIDLDLEVSRASKDRPTAVPMDTGATLIPADVTTAAEAPKKRMEQLDAAHVFANLKGLKPLDADEE
jgi:hypothetical protein